MHRPITALRAVGYSIGITAAAATAIYVAAFLWVVVTTAGA